MLELNLVVRADDLEEVLDSILPALPGGLHISDQGETVGLTMLATTDAPGEEELRGLVGDRLIDLSVSEASDDWRDRRLSRYTPLVVADRFLLRPEWAPPGEDPSLIEIVLGQSPAFGTGTHPTTQACLAVLSESEAGGSFADYGCGSGVLSIAAATLGWSPVIAVDIDESSLAATRANAERNGVEVDARRVDLTVGRPPPAETIAANVPSDVHLALAERLERAPSLLVASGFGQDRSAAVASAWEARGLHLADEVHASEWVLLVMR